MRSDFMKKNSKIKKIEFIYLSGIKFITLNSLKKYIKRSLFFSYIINVYTIDSFYT
jgi:hypothetical protein